MDRERLVLIAEGVPGTLAVAGGRKRGTAGAIALTQQRLAAYAMGVPVVDVTWDGGDARELDIAADDTGLTIAFDAADGSGRTELFLRIGDAPGLLAAIDQRRRPLAPRRRG
jgi:hypothetical protein